MKLTQAMPLLLLCYSNPFAQQSHINIYVSGGIDTANVEIAQVIRVWENYLNSNPDSTYDNPYWLTSEKKRYPKFDFLNTAYFSPSFYYFLPEKKATVMSVSEVENGYVIRTLFATQTYNGFSKPFCITQIVATKEEGHYTLCNFLPISTKSWQRETIGSITFVFPSNHRFNRKLAEQMNAFVDSLTTIWNLKPVPNEFYLASDLSEIMKIRGFDFYIGEGNNRGPGGVADIENHIVFGAGQDEWYPHEFVHIYINPIFPYAHHYFLEGYAALLGGSKGHELLWHMKRMNQYLKEHQEFNLNDLLAFWHFDNTTDPQYVFGGLLCKMALEKGGLTALKQLMSFGNEDKDFYKAVETVFGVKQSTLNDFIRAKLSQYVIK